LTIVAEFYKGARAIQAKNGGTLAGCAIELTHRNTRRYGGYIVHMGIVLMFIGFTGQVFSREAQDSLNPGDTLKVGPYAFHLTSVKDADQRNYASSRATMEVSKNGKYLDTMYPERRFYHGSQQPVSEVVIRPRLSEDLYIVFAGLTNDGSKPVFQVFVNPLVNWVWLGAMVVIFGTLTALVPSKLKLAYARTQVIGTTKKHEVLAQG
ncbi:MAG TPA: cytochrome c-type biogenesis CcmF C-terminal domain-containing protein, partial [Bryobacterales bacterium]|nr:cytochrome c-type biogenesis CcmF C-terminal domain-containing protein [Bryobacterales bacterium]